MQNALLHHKIHFEYFNDAAADAAFTGYWLLQLQLPYVTYTYTVWPPLLENNIFSRERAEYIFFINWSTTYINYFEYILHHMHVIEWDRCICDRISIE